MSKVPSTVVIDLSEVRVVDGQEFGSLNQGLFLFWFNLSLAGTFGKSSSHVSVLVPALLPEFISKV